MELTTLKTEAANKTVSQRSSIQDSLPFLSFPKTEATKGVDPGIASAKTVQVLFKVVIKSFLTKPLHPFPNMAAMYFTPEKRSSARKNTVVRMKTRRV